MTDCSYSDHAATVIDDVDDPVIPYTHAIVVFSDKFAESGQTGILGQLTDVSTQTQLHRPVQTAEIPLRWPKSLKSIGHNRAC